MKYFRLIFRYLFAIYLFVGVNFDLFAGPDNIAPSDKVTTSSEKNGKYSALKAIDGLIGIENQGEWASASGRTSWGAIDYPWIKLEWEKPQNINRIILYDRPIQESHIAGGTLHFSDGTSIFVNQIPNDGRAKAVDFP